MQTANNSFSFFKANDIYIGFSERLREILIQLPHVSMQKSCKVALFLWIYFRFNMDIIHTQAIGSKACHDIKLKSSNDIKVLLTNSLEAEDPTINFF